jgi:hypothetical protein
MPRLHDEPGTVLRLLVVATGPRHCVGVDLESGALARAWSPGPLRPGTAPYDIVKVTLSGDEDLVPDPTEPEAVPLESPPEVDGHMSARAARRLIRPLLHPAKGALLGSHGATVPFWERSPDRPSVAVAEPPGGVLVTMDSGQLWCHFRWSCVPHVLACRDPRLEAALHKRGRRAARLRPGTLTVVALSPPLEGHCHKVIEAVLPRR